MSRAPGAQPFGVEVLGEVDLGLGLWSEVRGALLVAGAMYGSWRPHAFGKLAPPLLNQSFSCVL